MYFSAFSWCVYWCGHGFKQRQDSLRVCYKLFQSMWPLTTYTYNLTVSLPLFPLSFQLSQTFPGKHSGANRFHSWVTSRKLSPEKATQHLPIPRGSKLCSWHYWHSTLFFFPFHSLWAFYCLIYSTWLCSSQHKCSPLKGDLIITSLKWSSKSDSFFPLSGVISMQDWPAPVVNLSRIYINVQIW